MGRLEHAFPGMQICIPFTLGSRKVSTAARHHATDTHQTTPLQLIFHTPWGPKYLALISFAIMPGTDEVVLLGLVIRRKYKVNLDADFLQVIGANRHVSGQEGKMSEFLGNVG